MKRSRKTLFALLLALVMALGLAATAWATGEVPTDTKPLESELSIKKVVEKTGDVTPPAETFTFVLEDGVKEGEKHPPAYYGITLMDDLKISTAAGTGTFEKTFKFKLPAASDFERYHWTPGTNVGSNEIARYYKSFLLTEKNGGKAGWQYSTKEYAVTFTYRTEDRTMSLEIHTPGNDDYSRSAEFTNSYTENLATVEVPFTKTVKLGGNTAPGKTEFTLEIFDIGNSNVDCKNVPYTAAVTTNGAGSYKGTLIISGTVEQIRDIVGEGFSVREKKGSLSGWTYSDAVWRVEPSGTGEDENGIPTKMNIYPTKLDKTESGEVYVPDKEKPVEQMTFENIYTYSTTPIRREKPNTPEPAIASPKTFDAGVALYGVSALLSLAGTALVIKRKNG